MDEQTTRKNQEAYFQKRKISEKNAFKQGVELSE
jgi:hypothetical protein